VRLISSGFLQKLSEVGEAVRAPRDELADPAVVNREIFAARDELKAFIARQMGEKGRGRGMGRKRRTRHGWLSWVPSPPPAPTVDRPIWSCAALCLYIPHDGTAHAQAVHPEGCLIKSRWP
jgi:hypothetical protein